MTMDDAYANRQLFISPHLDDAVFACGALIASSKAPVVTTVFAGRPPPGNALTSWDAECGFAAGDDVIGLRRNEDRDALNVLAARPVWLDFRDDQYQEARTTAEITATLAGIVDREAPAAVYFPLGLFHSDHRRASDGAVALIDRFDTIAWHAYEDAIYRRIAGAVNERVRMLTEARFVLERRSPRVDRAAQARKRQAVSCYRSQLRGLRTRDSHDDVFAPEACWAIASRRGAAA
jgi:LmbE family N-acetylglucosaminyl deacetylase